MAFFKGDIWSNSLDMATSINVILPHDRVADTNKSFKTVFLLHGLTDNASAWQRYTSIERYANEHNLAVIIPEVQRSFYTDMVLGPKYFTYIADELPGLCVKMFNISEKRDDTIVAGLSMGGYGALKVALSRPERFGLCGAFSSAVDMERRKREWLVDKPEHEFYAIFGPNVDLDGKNDIFKLATELPKQNKPLPRIFMTCGFSDTLYEENIRYRDMMKALPYEFNFEEWEGEHEWGFWDVSIKKMFDHFLT